MEPFKPIMATGLLVLAAGAQAADVGYYDMFYSGGEGNPNQVASILAAGHTPVLLTDLSAADLAGIDVLYVQNPSNGAYGGEYITRVPEIEAAVAAGMVLIMHDRFVTPAETILPGGAGLDIIRETDVDTANIDILDDTTLVTNGPGGVLDDSSLDGGTLSSHGFALAGTLPGDGVNILSRTDPEEIVTMYYPFEGGSVVYSTIPLDYYFDGGGPNPPRSNFTDIYAPNVVAYGAEGACGVTLEIFKSFRHTNVCFEFDNDGDGETGEDPFDFIDNDRDGLFDEDSSECPDGTSAGDPIFNNGAGTYFVDSVLKKDGSMASYNPGQLYAVTSVYVLRDTTELQIAEFNDDCTLGPDDLLDLNPANGGGRALIVVELEDGTLVQYFDANTDHPDVYFFSEEVGTLVIGEGDFMAGDIIHL